MRVSVISHSYVAEENQKNITALARGAELNVLLPRTMHDRVFKKMKATHTTADGIYHTYRRLGVGSQYLLATPDLNFRAFRPQLVHLEYDPWSTIFWQAAAYRSRFAPDAKIVCTVKNNTYRRYPGLLGTLKHKMATAGIARVDHFIAASRMVADLYADRFGVEESRLTVMHHLAVDTERFAPRENGRPTGDAGIRVGYCGRLDPDKGVLELIEATEACRQAGIGELQLELLGNGQLRETLLDRARETPWLRVLPPVPHAEVPDFLQQQDLFVLPARVSEDHEEHDAHALLEAMAVGLPSIGTRSGIIPEILDGGSGLLIEPNSTDSIRQALTRICGDPGLREELGSRARQQALDSFSLDALATRRLAIYEGVLHGN